MKKLLFYSFGLCIICSSALAGFSYHADSDDAVLTSSTSSTSKSTKNNESSSNDVVFNDGDFSVTYDSIPSVDNRKNIVETKPITPSFANTEHVKSHVPEPISVSGRLKDAMQSVAQRWGYEIDWKIDESRSKYILQFPLMMSNKTLDEDLHVFHNATKNNYFRLHFDVHGNQVIVVTAQGDQ